MGADRGSSLVYLPPGLDPRAAFAGRSLLERAIVVSTAAGLEPTLITTTGVAATLPDGVPRCRPGDRLPGRPGTGPIVLLRADAAFVAGALRDLSQTRRAAAENGF